MLAVACAVVGGMGYHTTEIIAMGGPESIALLMKLLSILALYTKIFSIGSFVLITQACAVFVVIWAMILFVGAFTICTPVAFNWDKFNTVGTCGDIRMLWAVTGGAEHLLGPGGHAPSHAMYKKIGLMVTFGIGLAVCIVSAVRLAEIIHIDMNDFPFSGGIALMFSALEPCLLVTAACIPLLRPLVSGPNSTAAASSGYARGKSSGNGGGNHSATRKAGFSELQDDNGSTRELRMGGRSQFGGDANAAAGASSFDLSDGAHDHCDANVELKNIKGKRDWKVEESAV
ncbi:mitochondrial carrier [Apiospora arundinis]